MPETVGYERLEATRLASVRSVIPDRDKTRDRLALAAGACGNAIAGPATLVFHLGTTRQGMDVEIGYPVNRPVRARGVRTRTLESVQVYTATHDGSPESVRNAQARVYARLEELGVPAAETRREVFLAYDPSSWTRTTIQTQVVVHDWPRLLEENARRVLGTGAACRVTAGADAIVSDSSPEVRATWIQGALRRLEDLTTETERYEILSGCAHVFPAALLARWRALYRRTADVDKVLEAIRTDSYLNPPVREGRVIVCEKRPSDPDGHRRAGTREEKIRTFCHCPAVKRHPDKVTPAFCYCGAGWFRQVFEGILGRPLEIETVETVLRGGQTCRFAVHLPER